MQNLPQTTRKVWHYVAIKIDDEPLKVEDFTPWHCDYEENPDFEMLCRIAIHKLVRSSGGIDSPLNVKVYVMNTENFGLYIQRKACECYGFFGRLVPND